MSNGTEIGPEEILAQFDAIKLADANEAETRLKVIDLVLRHVFGWTLDDQQVEERVSEDGSTQFSDYTVSSGRPHFVLEAKRVGATFDTVPKRRRTPLKGEIMKGELGEAIKQARDYARKLAIPFAIVTNGDQWIVFPATRTDGVSFEESSAIIFDSLRSLLNEDYFDAVDLLHRDSVISGSLEQDLLGRVADQIEVRRLNSIERAHITSRRRNPLLPLIDDVITSVFTDNDIPNDPALLSKLYVHTANSQRFDGKIKMHLARRSSAKPSGTFRPTGKKADRTALKEKIESAGSAARPLALLILGPVGAGKTTFLNYTRSVKASDVFEKDPSRPYSHWIYVDFRECADDESVTQFIHSRMFEYIKSDPFLSDFDRCVRHAYKSEIDALSKGPLGPIASDAKAVKEKTSELLMSDFEKVAPYVEKITQYAVQNSSVFLVIDNVDQFGDEAKQAEVFTSSMALARRFGVNLIVALREATYIKHRNLAAFDAFDYETITIDPPAIASVLSRRFTLAKESLKDRPGDFVAEGGVRFVIDDMSIIFEMFQASVLGSEIGVYLAVMATGDVRLALRLTREFFQAGYSDPGRAVGQYQKTGKYLMPRHEALRAIILGNSSVYREDTSQVANIFDSYLDVSSAQQLRLFVMNGIVNMNTVAQNYVDGADVFDVCARLGFGDEQALRVLEDLCDKRLLFTQSHAPASREASFAPSQLGGYIMRDLIANMTYLEQVMYDTFISDIDVWNRMRGLNDEIRSARDMVQRIKKRTQRVQLFYDHTMNEYDHFRDEATRRGLAAEWCGHPIQEAREQMQRNLKSAILSAERSSKRSRRRR